MATTKKANAKKSKKVTVVPKAGEEMVIFEIKDITLSRVLDISKAELKKLSPQDTFSKTVSGEIVLGGTPPAETNNIQVIWALVKDNKPKTKYRGVGGSLTYDAATKEFSITGLKNVSKLSLGVSGILDIGPVPVVGQPKPVVAHLNVSIGNLNKEGDWIINLSKKDKDGEGSYIKLNALIDWAKTKAPIDDEVSTLELPTEGSEEAPVAVQKKPEDFTIMFNDMYINITNKTFRFDVQSKAGEEMTFGNFTIRDIGFIVTNEPFIATLPEGDDDDSVTD
ncbi:MAG: hypothetical protein JWQ38_2304 [Flavipsychrobacter sp.]|nr:hypothetical protein [Flavipsychrobacter sp.]